MIAFGVCDSIGSFAFGQIVRVVGRWPCFAIAALINYAVIITMFIWRPLADRIVVLFILAGLWGVADAVWQSQTSALYGVLFTENNEAAFSNYRLWESTGFALFYILIPRIRTRITLIILLIFLSVGISGYALVEYRWRTSVEKEKKAKNNQVPPSWGLPVNRHRFTLVKQSPIWLPCLRNPLKISDPSLMFFDNSRKFLTDYSRLSYRL